MPLAQGFIDLGAGLSVGLAGLAAGFAIGIVGDAGVRGTAQQPRLFVGMVCPLPLLCLLPVSDACVDLDSHLCGSLGFVRCVGSFFWGVGSWVIDVDVLQV